MIITERIDCGNKCIHFTNRRMEQLRISDGDPTMAAKRAFENILDLIQSSNLNFQLQLSPFSASISLKKSLIRDKTGKVLLPHYPPAPAHEDHEADHHNSLLVSEKNKFKSCKLRPKKP